MLYRLMPKGVAVSKCELQLTRQIINNKFLFTMSPRAKLLEKIEVEITINIQS